MLLEGQGCCLPHNTHSGHCMVPKCAQADFDVRPGSSSSFLIGPRGVRVFSMGSPPAHRRKSPSGGTS